MMSTLEYPFSFHEDASNPVNGTLRLDEPLAYPSGMADPAFYRPGSLRLEDGKSLELALYHNEATARFIYLRNAPVDHHLLAIAGIDPAQAGGRETIRLPGQLCFGAKRTSIIGKAIHTLFRSPALTPAFEKYRQENFAVFPIAREGLKYQVAEAIFDNFGYYCDEIVLDAHHVFDSSVPVYNRKVEMTIFKDKDLDPEQRDNIRVAFLADGIASGLVMKEVIARVHERFENLQQVEVIAPLATIRGLCRIVQAEIPPTCRIRVHVFETLLNALPPDFYYSAHLPDPSFHIRPDLEAEYRQWWGQDAASNTIADTACAGYGWSEVFFSPRKQIEMINGQLLSRHNLTIADIFRRNFEES